MRRLPMLAVAALVAWFALSGTLGGARGASDGGYRVRAVFDNASAAAPGEDVKVAGARVGEILSLDVTRDRHAAIVLRIDDARFTPFHADARCTLRPEGVLAVKYVECDPGTSRTPALPRAADGAHRLPLRRTSSPVDLDLLNDMVRRPTGQQLTLLLSELGTGVAGRGAALDATIRRAEPALAQTDRVLRTLALQRDRLERFTRDADRVLAPLARRRRALGSMIAHASRVTGTTAGRAADVRSSLRRLPGFLTALERQMTAVAKLTQQGVPAVTDLADGATRLSGATERLAAFSRATTPAIRSLGRAAPALSSGLHRSTPLLRDVTTSSRALRPVARDLAALTTSFEDQRGVSNLMGLLYFATNAVNGFDAVGHYARAEPLSGACSSYTASGVYGCDAHWGPTAKAIKPKPLTPVATAARADDLQALDYLLAP